MAPPTVKLHLLLLDAHLQVGGEVSRHLGVALHCQAEVHELVDAKLALEDSLRLPNGEAQELGLPPDAIQLGRLLQLFRQD